MSESQCLRDPARLKAARRISRDGCSASSNATPSDTNRLAPSTALRPRRAPTIERRQLSEPHGSRHGSRTCARVVPAARLFFCAARRCDETLNAASAGKRAEEHAARSTARVSLCQESAVLATPQARSVQTCRPTGIHDRILERVSSTSCWGALRSRGRRPVGRVSDQDPRRAPSAGTRARKRKICMHPGRRRFVLVTM